MRQRWQLQVVVVEVHHLVMEDMVKDRRVLLNII
jgi:hypothetical protein